ncbi:MAG: hypothetical protein J2P58_07870 [Acidimicrobiaceae bacterium]|nr:hypothetical protein [Acidimicrobiaceae bacterium]
MNGGFEVDHEALTALGSHLSGLRGQFESGEGVIEPLIGTISHSGLKGALQSFATNWSDERKNLDGRMQQVAEHATRAGQTYAKGDSVTASGFKDGGH